MAAYYSHSCLMFLYIVASASIAMASESLDVSITPQPWYNRKNREKICDQVPHDMLRCPNNQSISVHGSTCVTFDETAEMLEVGKCLYNNHYAEEHLKIDKESIMCNETNRTGTLCGKCKDGHYPLAYSYDMNCVECPDGKSNWWKFVLAAFLPLTVFYFTVLLFNINLTSSYLLGFVFNVQSITVPALARVTLHYLIEMPQNREIVRLIFAAYGIWNLDFLRSLQLGICLGTDTLQTLALDLAVGVYPLLLMVLSYLLIHLYDRNFRPLVIIWKPFRAIFHENWDIRTSLIDAFANLPCPV